MKFKFFKLNTVDNKLAFRIMAVDLVDWQDITAFCKQVNEDGVFNLIVYHPFFVPDDIQQFCDTTAMNIKQALQDKILCYGQKCILQRADKWSDIDYPHSAYTIKFGV
jgi:hypothetical protein